MFFVVLFLPEAVGEQLDFNLWIDALVDDVVDGIEDGHIDMQVPVDLLHALRAEVAFCYHLHLYLCAFHRVALSDHGSEGPVATKIGVGGYKQVAQIGAVVHISLDGMYGGEESIHLLNGIGGQYCLEVISVFESRTDARRNGIYVLQHRGILDSDDIVGYFRLGIPR